MVFSHRDIRMWIFVVLWQQKMTIYDRRFDRTFSFFPPNIILLCIGLQMDTITRIRWEIFYVRAFIIRFLRACRDVRFKMKWPRQRVVSVWRELVSQKVRHFVVSKWLPVAGRACNVEERARVMREKFDIRNKSEFYCFEFNGNAVHVTANWRGLL